MKKIYLLTLLAIISITTLASCKNSANGDILNAYEKSINATDFNCYITIDKTENSNTYKSTYDYTMKDSVIHFVSNSNFLDGSTESIDRYNINDISYDLENDTYVSKGHNKLYGLTDLRTLFNNYYLSQTTFQYGMYYDSDILMYKLINNETYSKKNDSSIIIDKFNVKIGTTTSNTNTTVDKQSENNLDKYTYIELRLNFYTNDTLTKTLYYTFTINYNIELNVPESLEYLLK